jgi:hypothetical protein
MESIVLGWPVWNLIHFVSLFYLICIIYAKYEALELYRFLRKRKEEDVCAGADSCCYVHIKCANCSYEYEGEMFFFFYQNVIYPMLWHMFTVVVVSGASSNTKILKKSWRSIILIWLCAGSSQELLLDAFARSAMENV